MHLVIVKYTIYQCGGDFSPQVIGRSILTTSEIVKYNTNIEGFT